MVGLPIWGRVKAVDSSGGRWHLSAWRAPLLNTPLRTRERHLECRAHTESLQTGRPHQLVGNKRGSHQLVGSRGDRISWW